MGSNPARAARPHNSTFFTVLSEAPRSHLMFKKTSRYHPERFRPTFARFRRFRVEDRVFARLEQRQFAVTASKGPSKLVVDGGPTLKRAALLVPRHTSPLIARCTWLALVMPARAAPADGRSATGCRRTSVAAQRPRPSGRSRSDRGSPPSRRS